MQKRIINPWTWQEQLSYVQAVEVKDVESTLYCAGQAAVHPDGKESDADMRTQLALAIQNLETVISQSGYECRNIVKLTVYTTSSDEFINKCFDIFQDFVARHEIKTVVTLMQVVALNGSLNIELDVTAVK
jgi:2-iminobutanoate/2-iminopropanoate deaminase